MWKANKQACKPARLPKKRRGVAKKLQAGREVASSRPVRLVVAHAHETSAPPAKPKNTAPCVYLNHELTVSSNSTEAKKNQFGGEMVRAGTASATDNHPLSGTDRLLNLDVLRGISLFGILVVNMAFYSLPMFYYPRGLPQWHLPIDRHLDTLIHYAGETEFLTLFSVLFGLGLAIQLSRSCLGHEANLRFFLRVTVLLIFGLIHAFMIWMGDVLVWYAVAAIALWLFRSASPKRIFSAAVLIFVFRIVRLEVIALLTRSSVGTTLSDAVNHNLVQQCLRIYAHGSFSEIFVQRYHDLWFQYSHPVDLMLHILTAFLIGLYCGREGIFQRPEESRALVIRVWYFGGVIGIVGHILRRVLPQITPETAFVLEPITAVIGDGALAFFYFASVILAMNHRKVATVLRPLADVGRMTLTNYLCQSVICTTLAYGYGFGLYGMLRPLHWLLIAIAIYSLQVILSVSWLKRFAYGPAEWIWRVFVYGKRIPMRLHG